jgi:1-acyl-sn-glycerol-3-phosphate acyltransferase
MDVAMNRWSLDRIWRTLVTVLCFVCFALGGMLLSLTLIPLLLFPRQPELKRQRARQMAGYGFRLLLGVLRLSGCMRLETSGLERLKSADGCLILANHPSYIDVVVLLSLIPSANCVVKSTLWFNPFYGGVVRAAGYVNNTVGDALIDACTTALQGGEALLLFPEGTRSMPGEPLRFRRGAAHIVMKAAVPVIPVIIVCDPPVLTKGTAWWLAPEQAFTFRLAVQAPLTPGYFAMTDLPAGDVEPVAIGARRLTDGLEEYFSRELKLYGYGYA